MPKPTRKQVLDAIHYNGDWRERDNADAVMAIINAAWAKSEQQLEPYIQHKAECDWWLPRQEGGGGCSCGLYALLDGNQREQVQDRDGAVVPGDLEQFNRDQRLRREAYATAMDECGYIGMGGPMDEPRGTRLISYQPQPDGTTRRVVTYGTEAERFRSALEKIATADLRRTSAGWLRDIAKEALK